MIKFDLVRRLLAFVPKMALPQSEMKTPVKETWWPLTWWKRSVWITLKNRPKKGLGNLFLLFPLQCITNPRGKNRTRSLCNLWKFVRTENTLSKCNIKITYFSLYIPFQSITNMFISNFSEFLLYVFYLFIDL